MGFNLQRPVGVGNGGSQGRHRRPRSRGGRARECRGRGRLADKYKVLTAGEM